MSWQVLEADCVEALRKLVAAASDFRVAVETDPDWRDENAEELDVALIEAREVLREGVAPNVVDG